MDKLPQATVPYIEKMEMSSAHSSPKLVQLDAPRDGGDALDPTRVWGTRRNSIPSSALTIQYLPFEIICSILRDSIHKKWERAMDAITRYSLVSRRFRQMVLDTPSLWAEVGLATSMPAHIVEIIAHRSGGLGLDVFIWLESLSDSDQMDAARMVCKYVHKWEGVEISLSEDCAQYIQSEFPNLNVPLARTLKISYVGQYAPTQNFLDWTFPNLCSLRCDSVILSLSAQILKSTPKLEECVLVTRSGLTEKDITDFLSAVSNITRLTLHLEGLEDSDDFDNQSSGTEGPNIELPVLDKLTIVAEVENASESAIIFGNLLCPQLKVLKVKYCWNETDDFVAFSQQIRFVCPSLEKFEIRAIVYGYRTFNFFGDFLRHLPSTIKELRFRSDAEAFFDSDFIIDSEGLPHLKTLDLRGCSMISQGEEDIYEDLSAGLKRLDVMLDTFGAPSESCSEDSDDSEEFDDSNLGDSDASGGEPPSDDENEDRSYHSDSSKERGRSVRKQGRAVMRRLGVLASEDSDDSQDFDDSDDEPLSDDESED